MRGPKIACALTLLLVRPALGQDGCADQRCYSSQQYTQQYCPQPCPQNFPEPQGGPEHPAAYLAPPPAGEMTGGTNALGLRFGALRIPEISIPLPTIQMPHLVHYHREPEVRLDRGVASLHRNAEVLDFAQIPPEPVPAPQRVDEPADAPYCAPQCPQQCAPTCPPAYGPRGCGEASLQQKELESRLRDREQQVDDLKVQLAQLQAAVGQLAARQQAAAPVQPAAQSQPVPQKPQAEQARPVIRTAARMTADDSPIYQPVTPARTASAKAETPATKKPARLRTAGRASRPERRTGLMTRFLGKLRSK